MAVNKNQYVWQYSGKVPIIRIETVGESAAQARRIVEVFEHSAILFQPDRCYAFQDADVLNRLLNRDKSTPFTHITEAQYTSWIVYSNTDNERMVIYNTSDVRSIFRNFEKLIKDSNYLPVVKIQDLYNDKKAVQQRNRKDNIEHGKRISVAKHKIIRTKLRKVSFPRRKPDTIAYPLDEDRPIEERGSSGVSEQVVSAQLTRSERLRPDISSAWYFTEVPAYALCIGDSRPVFNQADTSPPPKYPEYMDYPIRKASFSGYPHSSPLVSSFCDAGFFFTKQNDLVRCFQCGIGLKDFSRNDDPLLEHVRFSQNCEFLNKSLDSEIIERIKSQSRQTNSVPHHIDLHTDDAPASNYSGYRHPEYISLDSRLATYDHWPSTHGQTREQLAAAGLYYTGYDDLVRCFSCDGGLRRWEPEDDPWTEHCRWFPTCKYARETKGEEFIAMVQAMVLYEEEEAGAAGGQGMTGAMQKLTITNPQVKAVLDENKKTVVEMMGFDENDFNDAVMELKLRAEKGVHKVNMFIKKVTRVSF